MRCLLSFSLAGLACAFSGCSTTEHTRSTEPTGFTFHIADGTFASFGWSGAVHDVVGPVDTPFEVKTTQCEDDACRFEGPITSSASRVDRRRCLFRMSTTCTQDSDCPLDAGVPTACVYIYNTPISTPLIGTDNHIGACSWTYIPLATDDGKPTITGTLDLATGHLNLESFSVLLPLNAIGMGRFAGACAECVGDTSPNDGVKDGKCMLATHLGNASGSGGPTPIADPGPGVGPDSDLGKPCDVHRVGTIGGYDGNYSMDCSPTVKSGLGKPLAFGGSFTSGGVRVAITPQSPDCTDPAFLGKQCFCGMCNDGTACMSNADCRTGTCIAASMPADQGNMNNVPVGANMCVGQRCNWNDAASVGTCISRVSGVGLIGCYPDMEIVIPGRSERDSHVSTVYHADTAGARCIPAGPSAVLNRQLGLPGLLLQKRNFQITPIFAEGQR
jgi:hypothetical protein